MAEPKPNRAEGAQSFASMRSSPGVRKSTGRDNIVIGHSKLTLAEQPRPAKPDALVMIALYIVFPLAFWGALLLAFI